MRKITVDNVDSIRLLKTWGKGRADQVFSNPGSDYVVVSGVGLVSVYQGTTYTPVYQLSGVQAVAVSFATNVVVASYQGLPGAETPVKIYDLKSGVVRAQVSHKLDRYPNYAYDDLQRARTEGLPDVTALALSPDGASLVAGFGDGSLEAWSISGTPASITRQAYAEGARSIHFSPSGQALLVDNQLYQFPGMKTIKAWSGAFIGPVMPDGKSAFLSAGITVFQIDMETGKELARIPFERQVTRLGLTADGKTLAVYTDKSEGYQDVYHFYRELLSVPDWTVIEPDKPVGSTNVYGNPGAQPPLTEVGYIPALQGANIVDGKPIAWGMYGSLPFWWFPLDGKVVTVPVPDGTPVGFHYPDQTIVTCSQEGLSVWPLAGPAKNTAVAGLIGCDQLEVNHKGDVAAIAIGPDIDLVNLTNAKARFLQESSQDISALAFSADDSVISAGTTANRDASASIFFWNGTAGYPISQALFPEDKTKPPKKKGEVVLQHDAAAVRTLLVSDDNRLGISFTENVRIWDIASGKQTGFIPYEEYASKTSGALSPDGSLLVLGDQTGQLTFWDIQRMANLPVLVPKFFKVHTGPVTTIVFSPDGNAILTAGEDGTLRLWGIP